MPDFGQDGEEIEIRQVFAAEDVAATFDPAVSERLGQVHEMAAEHADKRGDLQAAAELKREAQENKRHARSGGSR